MTFQFTSALLIASLCGAPLPQAPSAQNAVPAAPRPAVQAAEMLTIPAGTKIPLTLATPIHSKSTKVGDSVHAVVAFPVMAGNRVAIPAGSYVEGAVSAVSVRTPSVEIDFTRLVYTNGYSVPLSATNTQSKLLAPATEPEKVGELAYAEAPAPGAAFAQQQELPPLPSVGPPMGPIIGATLGGVGVLVVLAVLSHRRHGSADYVLFDNGWQFQMVLNAPLSVDASRVTAAMAAAPVKN